jgi:hypothetical protein
MKPLSILLFTALALPAFAQSITDLGPETHTAYYIGISEPSGASTETVIGTGGSNTDQFTFTISDPLGHNTGYFGDGSLAITGNINLSGNLSDIYLNPSTDVLTADINGELFDAPLTHVGQSYLETECTHVNAGAGDNWLCLGAGLLAMAGAMRRRLA